MAKRGLLLASACLALCAGAHHAAADDTEVAFEVRGAGDPALVFIHCWACNRHFWREQAAVFADAHRVVLIDLPGHGASGRDRADWTLTAYRDDVVEVVETLDLERVVLVGHAMGTAVALLAAATLGERVEGVICADSLRDAEYRTPEAALQAWIQAFRTDYDTALLGALAPMVPKDESLSGWIVESALEADRGAVIALIGDVAAFDARAALSAVDVPIRCINAVASGGFPLATSVEVNRRYADFDAVEVSGAGHFLYLERPDLFNEHMRALLAEIAGDQ